MRKVSVDYRAAHEGIASAEVEVGLIRLTHPEIDQVIRLSTDNTERLSAQPYYMGTRSTWLTADPAADPFLYVVMSALLPDDKEESPGAAQIVLDAVDDSLARALRSTSQQAKMDIAIVMASSPNRVEAQWRGLSLLSAEGSADAITLSFSRDRMTTEPWPAHRMGRSYFAGLFR